MASQIPRTINPVPHMRPTINLCARRSHRTSDTSRKTLVSLGLIRAKRNPNCQPHLRRVRKVLRRACHITSPTPFFRSPIHSHSSPECRLSRSWRTVWELNGGSARCMRFPLTTPPTDRRPPFCSCSIGAPHSAGPKTVNKISSWPITIWAWMSRCGNTSNQEEYVGAREGRDRRCLGVEGDEEATM